MKSLYKFAPARRFRALAGVAVFGVLAAGCDGAPGTSSGGDRTLELSTDTIRLESGVRMHDVKVRAVQNADFDPLQIAAKVGDIVRFTIADTRTHALVLDAPSDGARQLLESSGQRRSPPLVSEGQAWVVSLKGMPAGTYTVSCVSHAGNATVTVQ